MRGTKGSERRRLKGKLEDAAVEALVAVHRRPDLTPGTKRRTLAEVLQRMARHQAEAELLGDARRVREAILGAALEGAEGLETPPDSPDGKRGPSEQESESGAPPFIEAATVAVALPIPEPSSVKAAVRTRRVGTGRSGANDKQGEGPRSHMTRVGGKSRAGAAPADSLNSESSGHARALAKGRKGWNADTKAPPKKELGMAQIERRERLAKRALAAAIAAAPPHAHRARSPSPSETSPAPAPPLMPPPQGAASGAWRGPPSPLPQARRRPGREPSPPKGASRHVTGSELEAAVQAAEARLQNFADGLVSQLTLRLTAHHQSKGGGSAIPAAVAGPPSFPEPQRNVGLVSSADLRAGAPAERATEQRLGPALGVSARNSGSSLAGHTRPSPAWVLGGVGGPARPPPRLVSLPTDAIERLQDARDAHARKERALGAALVAEVGPDFDSVAVAERLAEALLDDILRESSVELVDNLDLYCENLFANEFLPPGPELEISRPLSSAGHDRSNHPGTSADSSSFYSSSSYSRGSAGSPSMSYASGTLSPRSASVISAPSRPPESGQRAVVDSGVAAAPPRLSPRTPPSPRSPPPLSPPLSEGGSIVEEDLGFSPRA